MKKFTSYTLLASALVWMASCGNSNQSNTSTADSTGTAVTSAGLPPLVNSASGDINKFFFDLNEVGQTDSSVLYTAHSLYNSDTVGFQVEVMKNIPAGVAGDGRPDGEKGFVEGGVKFSSIGAPSDNFVKSLGTIFNLPTDGKMSSKTLLPLIFSSNNKPVDLSTQGTYSFKYFFRNGTGREAEMFGVLDTYKKSFELSEKDSTYRINIISSFEGK